MFDDHATCGGLQLLIRFPVFFVWYRTFWGNFRGNATNAEAVHLPPGREAFGAFGVWGTIFERKISGSARTVAIGQGS